MSQAAYAYTSLQTESRLFLTFLCNPELHVGSTFILLADLSFTFVQQPCQLFPASPSPINVVYRIKRPLQSGEIAKWRSLTHDRAARSPTGFIPGRSLDYLLTSVRSAAAAAGFPKHSLLATKNDMAAKQAVDRNNHATEVFRKDFKGYQKVNSQISGTATILSAANHKRMILAIIASAISAGAHQRCKQTTTRSVRKAFCRLPARTTSNTACSSASWKACSKIRRRRFEYWISAVETPEISPRSWAASRRWSLRIRVGFRICTYLPLCSPMTLESRLCHFFSFCDI